MTTPNPETEIERILVDFAYSMSLTTELSRGAKKKVADLAKSEVVSNNLNHAKTAILAFTNKQVREARIELLEDLLKPKYGTKVLEVDGDYLRRLLKELAANDEKED